MSVPERQKVCIDSLQIAANRLGHSPSRTEYEALDILPDSSEIERRMGTWNAAKEQAGLETTTRPDIYTDEQCRAALQTAAKRLGHAPSVSEYNGLEFDEKPSVSTIKRQLGGWNTAKQSLNLAVDDASPQTYTTADCLWSVLDLALELGHTPGVTEYRENGVQPSARTVSAKLQGWRTVRTLVESAITKHNDGSSRSSAVQRVLLESDIPV